MPVPLTSVLKAKTSKFSTFQSSLLSLKSIVCLCGSFRWETKLFLSSLPPGDSLEPGRSPCINMSVTLRWIILMQAIVFTPRSYVTSIICTECSGVPFLIICFLSYMWQLCLLFDQQSLWYLVPSGHMCILKGRPISMQEVKQIRIRKGNLKLSFTSSALLRSMNGFGGDLGLRLPVTPPPLH